MILKRMKQYTRICKHLNRLCVLDVIFVEKYAKALLKLRKEQTITKE